MVLPAEASSGDVAQAASDDVATSEVDGGIVAAFAAMDALAAEDEGEVDSVAMVREALGHCSISPSGYVSCPRPPFDCKTNIGRVTTWPRERPMHARSVSCRCYVHPRCSFAKPRRAIDDNDLLSWLLTGVVDPSIVDLPTPKEQAAAHMEMGRKGAVPKSDAASSSGA